MIAALSYTVEGETGSTVTKLSYCFQISIQKKKGTGTMAQKTRAENRFVWFKQWTHKHSLQFHQVMSWVLMVCENMVL